MYSLALFNRISIMLFACLCYFTGRSQEYSYKHYEVKDGLVGNNVYQSVQDKEGFLWFATETGVSRFDGTSFKNFTTTEGLPDNEILRLYADSKGRVWMLPFKNTVCYYYKGKIHNAVNDSLLSRFRVTDCVTQMFEDKDKNLYFITQQEMLVIKKDTVIMAKNIAGSDRANFYGGGMDEKGAPWVFIGPDCRLYNIKTTGNKIEYQQATDSIKFVGQNILYTYLRPGLLMYLDNYDRNKNGHLVFNRYLEGHIERVELPLDVNLLSFQNDSILFFNTNHGAIKFNYRSNRFYQNFLGRQRVTSTITDEESNIWFCTMGNGVYRLISEESKNIALLENNEPVSAEAVFADDKSVIIGTGNSELYKIDKASGQKELFHIESVGTSKKVIKIIPATSRNYILGENSIYTTDDHFNSLVPVFVQNQRIAWAYKDMALDKDGCFYLSTHIRTLVCDSGKNKMPANFMSGRSTAVAVADSGLYLGTLKGLLFVNWKKNVTDLGGIFPLLANRITKLLKIKDMIWIGTNDMGVICFDEHKIIKVITAANGLTGNLVRCLYADSNYLWVGTDRGLNKISLLDTAYPVLQRYTTSDGISSDMINAVYVQHDTVYIATTKGLSFFNERQLNSHSKCDLKLLEINVSGKALSFDSTKIILKHADNNIRFDFVALSFKSEGNIVYYYKLSGIDTGWQTTRVNFLQYPTLPSGNYTMQLYAVNKFGVKSKTLTVIFEIEKQLIEEVWFILLVILIFCLLVWLLANRQLHKAKKVQLEKLANAKKIAILEQQALKAQMNPHFIFNSLNSIQQYVIDKDVKGANKFISGFSRLIRQTLDNSGKQNITVAEEESFLRSYLELEKSRFEEKFDYSIFIDEHIQKDRYCLPPMLLQPYIENCIRHGIMHKSNGKGSIEVKFNLSEGNLTCAIIDNGIGRAAANAFKGMQHVSYQSKGTELTAQRIMMINKSNISEIILRTDDLLDENGQPCGTKVTILIPLQKAD